MGRFLLRSAGATALAALYQTAAWAQEAGAEAAAATATAAGQQPMSISYDLGIAATVFGIFMGLSMVVGARLLPLYRDMAINLRTVASQVEGAEVAGAGDSYEQVPKAALLLKLLGWTIVAAAIARLALGFMGKG